MIYAIGDSFTFGDELADKTHAWPSVLSRLLNQTIINKGRPATGNWRMVKRAIDAVLDQSKMVIIGWSDPCRREFADDIGIYDIWAGRNWRALQIDNSTHRIDLIKYMTAYDTPEFYYVNWLRQIILIQSLCKLHDVSCVMFNACGAETYHRQYSQNHKVLVDSIDHSMFVDNMAISVGEWCYGTPHGPNGHPLEQGHEIIADKIYEHIRNKCWVS